VLAVANGNAQMMRDNASFGFGALSFNADGKAGGAVTPINVLRNFRTRKGFWFAKVPDTF
jgi:hypothetical protein